MALLENKHMNMENIPLLLWIRASSYESSFQVDLSDTGSGVSLPSCITSVSFH